MTIGDRIRIRRTELNMSQDELAQKIGYKSRSSINKIELGGHNLTQRKILDIANALNTTPSYIMGWTSDADEKPSVPEFDPMHIELINLYEQLTDESKKIAIELLRNLVRK